MRVTFDANVLVYAADWRSDDRHVQAIELLKRAGRADCVLTMQALGEFLNVALRKKGVGLREAISFVEDWRMVFQVHAASNACLSHALDVVERDGLPFWDAMLWAAAREAGCRYIFTEDFQDGRRLDTVTFINPYSPKNAALVDTVLPRD